MKIKTVILILFILLFFGCLSQPDHLKIIPAEEPQKQILFSETEDENFILFIEDLLLSHQWQILYDLSDSPGKELVKEQILTEKEYCALLFHSGWNDVNTGLAYFDPDEITGILWTVKNSQNSLLTAEGYFLLAEGKRVSCRLLIEKNDNRYLLFTE